MQHEILAIRKACLGIVGRRADAIEGIVFRSRLWPGLRIGSFYRTLGISDGERQVMDFIDGLVTVIAIVGAPVLLMGLAMFVVHQITRGRQNEIFGPPKKSDS